MIRSATLSRMRLIGLIALVSTAGFFGCAGGAGPMPCATTFVIDVSPSTVTADHMGAAPANQVVFMDVGSSPAPGQPTSGALCAYSQIISSVTWTSSDTLNVQLVTMPMPSGGTMVTATCMNATNGPVTITATQKSSGLQGTGTATLTCE